jgi:DNA-binding XRE family transcriptional regulator
MLLTCFDTDLAALISTWHCDQGNINGNPIYISASTVDNPRHNRYPKKSNQINQRYIKNVVQMSIYNTSIMLYNESMKEGYGLMKNVYGDIIVTAKFDGKLLKKYREETGLTQKQVAMLAQIDYQQWQRWEYGDSCPSADNLMMIASVLDIGLSTIFSYKEEAPTICEC